MLNKCLLPIYENLSKQFRFRINCIGSDLHTFNYPNYYLPAFFFMRDKRPYGIVALKVLDINGVQVASIDIDRLHIVTTSAYDAIGYTGGVLRNEGTLNAYGRYINELLPCGIYYYELTEDGTGNKYYSEIWKVTDKAMVPLADELIKNGTFSVSMAAWTTYGTWGVTSGVANYTGGVNNDVVLYQPISAGEYSPMGYIVQFTISNWGGVATTEYLQVRTVSGSTSESVLVTGNGTYTFYTNTAECLEVRLYGFSFNFSIDNISVKAARGVEDMVTIYLSNSCKLPNSIDSNYKYYNILLLDALILEPEYGEELKQEENGDIEKVNSYVRAFKRHRIDPLLLSEPVVNAIAQLNTFDIAGVHDGGRDITYEVNSMRPSYIRPSIMNFDASYEWQDMQCYCYVRILFDENLAIKDKCCDSNSDIEPCFDNDEDVNLALSLNCASKTFTISLANNPTSYAGAFIRLYYKKIANADYPDNCGFAATVYDTGIWIPFSEFAANGADFYAADADDYVYAFSAQLNQIGCDGLKGSNTVCRPTTGLVLDFTSAECFGETTSTQITFYATIPVGFGTVYFDLYNSVTSTWVTQFSTTNNGSNTVLLNGICVSGANYTKMRLHEVTPGGNSDCDRYSNEVNISLPDCCE